MVWGRRQFRSPASDLPTDESDAIDGRESPSYSKSAVQQGERREKTILDLAREFLQGGALDDLGVGEAVAETESLRIPNQEQGLPTERSKIQAGNQEHNVAHQ